MVASIGCSFSGVGFLFQNHYPRFTGAPSCRFRTLTRRPSFGGFGVRLRYDRHTMAYMSRRTGEGLSKSEIIRCLKRYVAREVFSALRSSSGDSRTSGLTSIGASFSLNSYRGHNRWPSTPIRYIIAPPFTSVCSDEKRSGGWRVSRQLTANGLPVGGKTLSFFAR